MQNTRVLKSRVNFIFEKSNIFKIIQNAKKHISNFQYGKKIQKFRGKNSENSEKFQKKNKIQRVSNLSECVKIFDRTLQLTLKRYQVKIQWLKSKSLNMKKKNPHLYKT